MRWCVKSNRFEKSRQDAQRASEKHGLFRTKWSAAGEQVRAAFREFMQKVSVLCGSGGGGGVVPEEEVNTIAAEVYRILGSWSSGQTKLTPKTLRSVPARMREEEGGCFSLL